MKLPLLVSLEKWQEFDDAWLECVAQEDPIDELLAAIQLAGSKKRMSSRGKQAKEHAASLAEAGRHAEAACLIGETLVAGGNPTDLNEALVTWSDKAWSSEPWYEPLRDLAGLVSGAPDLRTPWKAFGKLLQFQVGRLVYHPGGWGAGEVKAVDTTLLELTVCFWNGRQDDFPMHAAVEIFQPLGDDDLKAQHFRDPEGTKASAKKDPLEVLRTIVTTCNGRASTVVIRNSLMGIGIEGSAWSAWWRKARKLAENSEWLEVSGTPQKSVVTLLLAAKDPGKALAKALERSASLASAHARVRDLVSGQKADENLVQIGLELLAAKTQQDDEPLEERIAAWLFLRSQTGENPEALLEHLSALAAEPLPLDPATPPALWAMFRNLPNLKDQERAVELLADVYGDEWLDHVCKHLHHAAHGQVKSLVDNLASAGRQSDLRAHYADLLARPLRAPNLLVTLAGKFDDGQLDEGFPTGPQRAQALLNLAAHLNAKRRGDPHMTRVCTRLTALLAGGETPLLRRLLEGADAAALRSANVLVQRAGDSEIDHLLTDISLDFDRHFFAGQSGPFWQGKSIWTTRAGLEKRSAELRELREVKIPENQEAIGKAASFGDLSENSEWEAAIEEQRNLTTRAMSMEEELREVDLIEEAAIPEGTVAPGTIVAYRELPGDDEHRILILGPWDDEQREGIQVVSYRAPLAAGLLGLKVGASASVELPSGTLEIEVVGVEAPDLA